MHKFWHYVVIVAIVFAVLNIYQAQTLKGVPFVGGWLST